MSKLTSSRNGRRNESADGVDPRDTGDSRDGRSSSLQAVSPQSIRTGRSSPSRPRKLSPVHERTYPDSQWCEHIVCRLDEDGPIGGWLGIVIVDDEWWKDCVDFLSPSFR